MSKCSDKSNLYQIIQKYEAGFIQCQHCNCDTCQQKRELLKLDLCQNNSCKACHRIKRGEKIQLWYEDFTAQLDI
jgi:phage terminase large subunit GpA-like protein